ncbi:MAG: FecR domain-containing protein [Acetobacter sp.]|uniref:FecR family protein n=1 Tax=Acetobacter sp. TaxID=440 RepID=UPI0039E8CC40
MNVSSTDDDRQAVSEATEFLVLLLDDPENASLHMKIQRWRKADTAHDAAWRSMVDVWHLTGDIGPVLLPLEKASISPARSPVFTPRRVVAVASALCAVGFAFVFRNDIRLAVLSDYRTGTAENRMIELPDGSTATLGARSAIALHYTSGQRQINVLAGEVFFNVRHDVIHPFVVQAGQMTARDIGTRFDVNKSDARIDVAVNEGCIGLDYGNQGAMTERHMRAGDRVSIDVRSGAVAQFHVNPAEIGSWQEKRLTVSDATVQSVVENLRRYYPGFIVVYGSGLDTIHVAGSYDLTDIPGALKAVAAPAHVAIREIGSRVLLVGAKPS